MSNFTEGKSLIKRSRQFFKSSLILHLILAVLMLGSGIVSLTLSYGSNGSARIPYYFTAYFAFAWHASFILICKVCLFYLDAEGRRCSSAAPWVRAYSVSSSVLVLFNVMGVVFVVVNGICLEGQMCFYDKNETANRVMAIWLIILHCASILINVFLAKRAHVIDSQLNHDVSVKLNQPLDWLHRRSRRSSMTSALPSCESSIGSAASLSETSNRTETPNLSQVQTSKSGVVMTTVEISAKRFTKTHRRSKSHPNMVRNIDFKPDPSDGTMVPIFSDTEMRQSEEKKKKKIGLFRKKKNKIESGSVHVQNQPSMSKSSRVRVQQPTSPRLYQNNSDSEDDILVVQPVKNNDGDIHETNAKILLSEQRKLQEKQAQLLEQQQQLLERQQQFITSPAIQANVPPPPYQSWLDGENEGDIEKI
ncbi:uncharacterized protein LOC128243734 [Mya arenaria]|uniref:uncharacterized protein LOC128243734 n=1 Tax=Mya arenaria TaxID=6604 RepID=UPI0022E6D2C5|nr:uncharacterized protein LOC128243734 [Mya arenaria]